MILQRAVRHRRQRSRVRMVCASMMACFLLQGCGHTLESHDNDTVGLLWAYQARNEAIAEQTRNGSAPGVEALTLTPGADGTVYVSLAADDAPVGPLARSILAKAGVDHVVRASRIDGRFTGTLNNVPLPDILDILLTKSRAMRIMEGGRIILGDDPNVGPAPLSYEASGDKVASAQVELNNVTAVEASEALSRLYPSDSYEEFGYSVLPGRNSVMFTGSTALVRQAVATLQDMDHSAQHVFVEALLVEFDVESFVDLGTEFSDIQAGPISGAFFDIANLVGGTGAFTYTAGSDFATSFRAFLDLLIQRDEARIISRPYVTTISGRQATLNVTEDRFVITESGNGLDADLQEVSSGIQLAVQPTILASGQIVMAYEVVESRFIPTLENIELRRSRNTVQSFSRVQSGETVILGGLTLRSRSEVQAGIPGLRDIPLVGQIFGHTESTSEKKQIMVFLTPHIWKPGMKTPLIRNEVLEDDNFSSALNDVIAEETIDRDE